MPRLPGVHSRKRVFALLDRALQAPALWIEAPPGAGKTTLATTWLLSRKRPCVWYQVDPGDADPATFFHYLGLAAKHAAPRHKRPLPHLTPEFVPGLQTFARRVFEELFRRLRAGSVLVLDNAQDAGAEGALSDVLRIAVETLPATVRMVFLSRGGPPPTLARLIANGQLAVLERAAMQLTLDEARGVAAARGVKDAARVAAIHDLTRGWTAGLVLMLERASTDSEQYSADPETLFDYFATEILRRLDQSTRWVLLKSALLPKMRAADVEALTGSADAGRIIADLQKRNYFTYRLSPKDAVYEYHPLFREFLLSRLHEAVAPPELPRLRSTAAQLLEASGQIEAAADLWREAGDWSALADRVHRHAAGFLREGRASVVESWLAALPCERVGADPWLKYWLGSCRAGVEPEAAAALFSAAHEQFRNRGDATGVFLAWAAAVDAVWLQQKDATVFDAWINRLEDDLARFGAFPDTDVEATVESVLIWILLWRSPWHPDMARWTARARPLLARRLNPLIKARLACALVLYFRLTGDGANARSAALAAHASLGAGNANTLASLLAEMVRVYDLLFSGHPAGATEHARGLLRKSEISGLHVLDNMFNGLASYGALTEENGALADQLLGSMECALSGRPETLDTAHWHCLSSWRLRLAGDLAGALRHATRAVEMTERAGASQPELLSRQALAHVLFDQGDYAAAKSENDEAHRQARAAGFFMHAFESTMFDARVALALGDQATVAERLHEAFALAGRSNVTGYRPFWRREAWAVLHAEALERGVLPEVVRKRVREENLAPCGPASYLESWPWPVRIRVLGRFSIQRDEKPLPAANRGGKPLELLRALVALGGRAVAEAELAEMLWPDADGDRALASLKVNVHRLRRILGEERILWNDGLLSLDARGVWVDAWALERALGALERALPERQSERIAALAKAAVALHRGPYLRAESSAWAVGARERLRAKFLRVVAGAAEALTADRRAADAVRCYEKALEVDPVAERLYQGLMRCHLDLGQRADGLAVYRRCRETLARELALAPSPKSEALRTSLLSG